ncbi:response regulator [Sediminicola luteus]|uniref:Response regulator n=1 Tax=Sediminicola luteus TaxID=319238 RepID=A0ABV2TZ72_9FLAO
MTNKIVLVDDDPIIQYVHLRILKKYSSQLITQFDNGSDALEYFKGNGKEGTPYLVLLDINMPIMDGWEFLDAVYEQGLESNMKVIVLTSSVDILDMEKAKKYDNIISFEQKPLTVDKVGAIPVLLEYLEQG